MKPLSLTVTLVDPVNDERFPVTDDIAVYLVPALAYRTPPGPVPLTLDRASGVFSLSDPSVRAGLGSRLQVRFRKQNFSKTKRRLLSPAEVGPQDLPVYCPVRFPVWETRGAAHAAPLPLGWHPFRPALSPERPLNLEIPIRELFIIGHRGAPMAFPENTIASFERALELGANGLEVDLCLTKDRKLVVFHDPEPIRYPGAIDRTLFEQLPFPLVSPLFDITGREVVLKEWRDGAWMAQPPRPLAFENEFHVLAMTLEQMRCAYRYEAVAGTEYPIPTLGEFLDFVAGHLDRLRFIFFDMKNPESRDRRKIAVQTGEILGCSLQRYPRLPPHLVVCNENPGLLRRLRSAVRSTGEARCAFAYDAGGGLQAVVGMDRRDLIRLPWWLRRFLSRILPWSYNPLEVARRMKNTVVSVGNRMRPAHLRELQAVVRDRDFNPRSPIEHVIHWTLNEEAQFSESIDAGVNGILTDRPDALSAYLCGLDVSLRPPVDGPA